MVSVTSARLAGQREKPRHKPREQYSICRMSPRSGQQKVAPGVSLGNSAASGALARGAGVRTIATHFAGQAQQRDEAGAKTRAAKNCRGRLNSGPGVIVVRASVLLPGGDSRIGQNEPVNMASHQHRLTVVFEQDAHHTDRSAIRQVGEGPKAVAEVATRAQIDGNG